MKRWIGLWVLVIGCGSSGNDDTKGTGGSAGTGTSGSGGSSSGSGGSTPGSGGSASGGSAGKGSGGSGNASGGASGRGGNAAGGAATGGAGGGADDCEPMQEGNELCTGDMPPNLYMCGFMSEGPAGCVFLYAGDTVTAYCCP